MGGQLGEDGRGNLNLEQITGAKSSSSILGLNQSSSEIERVRHKVNALLVTEVPPTTLPCLVLAAGDSSLSLAS